MGKALLRASWIGSDQREVNEQFSSKLWLLLEIDLLRLSNKFSGLHGIRCEHEPSLPAGECVATMLGSHNVEHFFVGTQDLELRKRLRKVLV